jgi:DNA-binding NtrC family response regulator
MARILCVDDDPAVSVVLEEALRIAGHDTLFALNVNEAMDQVARAAVDLIISDYRMPNGTGLDLLACLQQEGYQIPLIMVTGYATIENAVEAVRRGAVNYLTKPIHPEALEVAVNQALELTRLRKENEAYRQAVAGARADNRIIGQSPQLRQVLALIASVAPTRATVLLEGESGTGKELFARAIHEQGPHPDGPFIALNCAAMPEGLIESALFGHEKGAFSGATARSAGAFERAHGGTLLLDEISEMRIDLQSKLLRVVQEQQFERVGGQVTITVDVRIVATTNRNLKAAVAAGAFREDLYYRLSVMPIRTPPLRERVEDIPALVRHFASRAAAKLGVRLPEIPAEILPLLQQCQWPGNIRELENAVERAVILARGGKLTSALFAGTALAVPAGEAAGRSGPVPQGSPVAASGAEGGMPEGLFSIEEAEKLLIGRALRASGGNRVRAAGLLGISERTLRNKLKPARPVT